MKRAVGIAPVDPIGAFRGAAVALPPFRAVRIEAEGDRILPDQVAAAEQPHDPLLLVDDDQVRLALRGV